jgi:hypothetical protein
MATVNGAQTRHANTAKIMIGNDVIAECISVSVREDTGADPVHITGTPLPIEHTHNRYSVQVSISRVVFKKGKLARYGVGGTSILEIPLMTIQGYDKADSALLFKVVDCTLSGRSLTINANTRLASDVSLMGLMTIATDSTGKPISSSAISDAGDTSGNGTAVA